MAKFPKSGAFKQHSDSLSFCSVAPTTKIKVSNESSCDSESD